MPPTDYRFKLGETVYIIRTPIQRDLLRPNACITEGIISMIDDRSNGVVTFRISYGKDNRTVCLRDSHKVFKTFEDAKTALVAHGLKMLQSALDNIQDYENLTLDTGTN